MVVKCYYSYYLILSCFLLSLITIIFNINNIISIPSVYAVEGEGGGEKITFRFSTSPISTNIVVDGKVYTTPVEFKWDRWSEHKITLQEHISIDENSRYALKYWSDLYTDSRRSIVADYDKDGSSTISYTIYYEKQYRLLLLDDEPKEQWYNAGSIASIEVEPVRYKDKDNNNKNEIRYVFSSWLINDNSSNRVLPDSNKLTVVMDKSLVIKPVYKKQYYISLSAKYLGEDNSSSSSSSNNYSSSSNSSSSKVKDVVLLGSGWYDDGVTARIACISDNFYTWRIIPNENEGIATTAATITATIIPAGLDFNSKVTTITVDAPYTIECILKEKEKEATVAAGGGGGVVKEQILPQQLSRLMVLTSYGALLRDGHVPTNSLVSVEAKDIIGIDDEKGGGQSRYVFNNWSEGLMSSNTKNMLMVDRDKIVIANYKKQYSIMLNGKHIGWYDEGSRVELRCPKPNPSTNSSSSSSDDMRYEFLSWEGIDSNNNMSESTSITVDKAYKLSCSWKELYRVQIISPYKVEGSGYYGKGSTVTIYASDPIDVGLGRKAYFVAFKGDVESNENMVSITVDKPYRIIALWREDSTQQYIIVGVLASGVAFTALLASNRLIYKQR
jgi:hypothetical protein